MAEKPQFDIGTSLYNKENNDYLEIDSASKRNLEIIKT